MELDLWQQQPVPESVAASLPLRRVLSMCTTPKYADVPVPDWCFDAWPEAGVVQGTFDEACARLAQVGAAPPTEGNQLSWCGTAHHHPSRMTLMDLAAAHPDKLACVNVVDKSIDKSKHRTLAEQVQGFPYLLDVQGKGYSSRLKLLLHTGRVIFIAKRPWQEYFADGLKPMVHYVPVKEDLSDLVDMYVCMHACIGMYVCSYACMCVCMHACVHACMHACMHACRCVCMFTTSPSRRTSLSGACRLDKTRQDSTRLDS